MVETIREPERSIPVAEQCDVLVCGGGPAGVAAAVAAARAGARTRLLEVQGCLGGIWTAGLLSYVLDPGGKGGFLPEIVARLAAAGAPPLVERDAQRPWVDGAFCCDPEVMKLVLEQVCHEAGVALQLHTRVVATIKEQPGHLTYVLTESKSGRQAWGASLFVDCTGDGDLAALAGCGFDYGRPGSGETQPMTLMAMVAGIREAELARAIHGRVGTFDDSKDWLLAEMRRAGVTPSYGRPTLFDIGHELYALMANHEYGYSGLDAGQVTQATLHARGEVQRIINALRALGGAWAGIRIVATAAHIGVREGRRIHGAYTVTAEDLLSGRRHPDAVCTVNFPVDVHATAQAHGAGYGNEGIRSRPYDIPLRALMARDIDNLLMAGRCISGDFLAHASYRVTGNAVPLGEAAGRLAAQAVAAGCSPAELRGEHS